MIEQLPKQHKILIGFISLLMLLILMIPADNASASRSTRSLNEIEVGERIAVDLAVPSAEIKNQEQEVAPLTWKTIKIKSGDSLALIFQRAGFSARTLHEITQINKDTAKKLQKIMPGDEIHFGASAESELLALRYPVNVTDTLVISHDGDNFNAITETKELEVRTEFAAATIQSNFYSSAIDSGLSPNLIMNLATVFGWDIDFALDLRKGDSFSVMYEKHYDDGEFVKNGHILAAEFVNQGVAYQAARHTDGVYYSPDGKAMKKAFLRSPVNFKYISSSFNPRRLHPVTGRIKAHRGIDYAAKTGTPVLAAGDGKVIAAGYTKYNGNYVFIKHGANIVTKYLHLHRKYTKTGQKVKQGKKIGSVGATGRVTGPHLHYEFVVNGVHRNPRTVKLPDAQPIKASEKNEFVRNATALLEQLESNRKLILAMR